ncbi:hypothetical protein KC322_g13 [Hortaea werneckii]|nr:hypothetical protein KC322_g13 [Hortaea werneckii]
MSSSKLSRETRAFRGAPLYPSACSSPTFSASSDVVSPSLLMSDTLWRRIRPAKQSQYSKQLPAGTTFLRSPALPMKPDIRVDAASRYEMFFDVCRTSRVAATSGATWSKAWLISFEYGIPMTPDGYLGLALGCNRAKCTFRRAGIYRSGHADTKMVRSWLGASHVVRASNLTTLPQTLYARETAVPPSYTSRIDSRLSGSAARSIVCLLSDAVQDLCMYVAPRSPYVCCRGPRVRPVAGHARAMFKDRNALLHTCGLRAIALHRQDKDNIIIPGAGIAMIPVLLIHDDQGSLANAKVLQDTKEIMDYFESMYPPGPRANYLHSPMQHAVVPPTPNRAFAAQLFELLADEWLLTQAMYWRWYAPHLAKQRKFLAMEFGNSSTGGLAPLETQQAIGEKRMARFAGFTPGLGVSETTSPALEWQFHELLRLMESHFDQYPFLLGDETSLADFAFWGSFGPHLGRDPVPSFIIKTEAPGVWEWIERVNSGHRWAGQHVRHGNGAQNSYGTKKTHAKGLDTDEVPESACDCKSHDSVH